MNDGSTDNTADIVRQFASVRYYDHQSNNGPSATRNNGIKRAKGEFLAFLDADDLWTKKKLMLQMAVFETYSGIDMVFGNIKQFYSPDVGKQIKYKFDFHTEIMSIHLPAVMLIKRESFFRVGFYEPALQIGECVDWYLRAKEIGLREFIVPEVVYLRRIHDMNKGITRRHMRQQYVQILKASLDRRRKHDSLGIYYERTASRTSTISGSIFPYSQCLAAEREN